MKTSRTKSRQKMEDSWLLLQRSTRHETQAANDCPQPHGEPREAGHTRDARAGAVVGTFLPAHWQETAAWSRRVDTRYSEMDSKYLV